jgi:hypothetical protein
MVAAKASAKSSENPSDLNSGDQELINAADFKGIELSFKVENTTTRTEVKDRAAISMVEFAERTMLLSLPVRSCAKGHHLTVTITTRNAAKDFEFSFTAKADEITSADKTTDMVNLTMIQFEEAEWQAFQNLFSNRQNEILEFFKAVKG